MSYRDLYEAVNGKIPYGHHLHHKIPRHMNGTDDLDNLICLTPQDHATAHLELYHQFGKTEDLCAYYMLSNDITAFRKEYSRLGGRIGGKVSFQNSTGVHTKDKEFKSKWCSMGGTAAQPILKARQIGAYYDPVLKKKISSMGGNSPNTAFKNSEWQSKFGHKGGLKSRGTITINDGLVETKFRPSVDETLEDFLLKNPRYQIGRIKSRVPRGEKCGGFKSRGSVWINDGQSNTKFQPKENETLEDFLLKNPQYQKGMLKK